MTDKKWQDLISKCRAAGDQHQELLREAENEYKRRYGNFPSEVNDDWWIDGLHYCSGSVDLKAIKTHAKLNQHVETG